jgi:predicted  nucleic acid-binding Zn-ribbon protein
VARLFDTDPTSDFARVSIPLLKFEDGPDGSVYVWGKATDGTLDRDEQIIDPAFAAKSLREWFETGANVRVMHSASLYPAGTGVELISQDDGQWLKSHIVEPTAVKLVKAKALTAYSVGISRPRIVRDSIAKGGRVVGGETVEVSLVDRPANPSCGLVLAKMAGGVVELLGGEILGEVPEAPRGAAPSPATLAADLIRHGHAAGAVGPDGVAKRDFDRAVGGGVDRDKLAASDFVFGDERAFPIVTPDDVADAVTSWGRYKGPHTFKQFRKALTSLADRKGEAFAAKLPAEWTRKRLDPDLSKGSKCPDCGASYDSGTSAKYCSNCGHKLPAKADKAAAANLAKGAAAAGADSGVADALSRATDAVRDAIGAQATDPDAHTDPNDAKVSAHLEAAEDAVNAARNAQATDMAQDDVEKAEKAATIAGVEGTLAPVEGMPYGLRRLHDALCGAYGWAAVKEAHPGLAKLGLGTVIADAEQLLAHAVRQAVAAMGPADGQRVAALSKAYAAAAGLAGADGQDIAEARAELVKDFRTANLDAPAMTPMGGKDGFEPGRWRRGYLSAGHANDFAKPGQTPRIPDTNHVPDASQFRRGPLTAGHAAESPENTGAGTRPVITSVGGARPTPQMAPGEGVTKSAGGVAAAMRAVHDHIAEAHPGCCPTAPDVPEQPTAAVQKGTDMEGIGKAAAAAPSLAELAGQSPDLLKAAIIAVVTEREAAQRAEYEAKIADLTATHERSVADLTAKFNELARQPDPRQAPFRGMAGVEQALLSKASQEPQAAATDPRTEYYRGWLESPDPAQREAARRLLNARTGS